MSLLRNLALVSLAVLIALAVLLWRLPASSALVFAPAQAKTQFSKFIMLHQIDGTLWHGSARFTAVAIPASMQLAWDCAPAFAALAIDCQLSGAASGRLRVQPFAQRVQAERVSSQFALRFAANPTVLTSSESVSVTLTRLEASGAQLALDGGIVARDASYQLGQTTVDLGEVFVDCKPAADNASSACTIKNRASAARLDGTLTLNAQRAGGSIELSAPGMSAQRISF